MKTIKNTLNENIVVLDKISELAKTLLIENGFELDAREINEFHIILSSIEEGNKLSNAVFIDIAGVRNELLSLFENYVEDKINSEIPLNELLKLKSCETKCSDKWGNLALEMLWFQ